LQVNIQKLIDDGQCYQTVRELRWPDGVACPSCQSGLGHMTVVLPHLPCLVSKSRMARMRKQRY
jgi:hypothetical protein